MKKIFTFTSGLLVAAVMILSGTANAQRNSGPTKIQPVTKVPLTCTVKATQIKGNNYNVKLEATNSTGFWIPQGKKIYFTFGPSAAESMSLGVMVPDAGTFTLKSFSYVANPYTPQTQGCTAYYVK
jgi:hypothetical protein